MSYTKPEQTTDQEFYISVEAGATAALPCRVQSVPPPTLSWFLVAANLLQPVQYGPRVQSLAHMLLVADARPGDAGLYCALLCTVLLYCAQASTAALPATRLES